MGSGGPKEDRLVQVEKDEYLVSNTLRARVQHRTSQKVILPSRIAIGVSMDSLERRAGWPKEMYGPREAYYLMQRKKRKTPDNEQV